MKKLFSYNTNAHIDPIAESIDPSSLEQARLALVLKEFYQNQLHV